MKVYELMNILEDMPSGATVNFSTIVSKKELKAGGVFDTDDNGRNLYSLSGEVLEVSGDGSGVYLSN